ncbi:hypothetical protein ACFYZ4_00045 [Streptomyces sp. NPDC001513]|uniref:hypothetical protein n=1 Tax=Streptomyces sp. NPDC001513 TaxID=3364580 RepID=UPI0036C6DF9C
MSLHYEVVFACFLRDDTPDLVVALRWHLGLAVEWPAELDPEEDAYPVLSLDPDSRLPGGDRASLRRHSRGFSAAGSPSGTASSSR